MGSLLSVPASASTSVPTSHDWEDPKGRLIRGFSKRDPQIKVVSVVDRLQEPELPPKKLFVEALIIEMRALGLSQKEVPYLHTWAGVIADQLLALLESGVPPHDYYCFHDTDVTKMVTRIYKQYARHYFRQSK